MTYDHKQVHEAIQSVNDFKQIEIDEKIFLFHAPTLSIISTNQSVSDLEIDHGELSKMVTNLPDVSATKYARPEISIKAIALNVAEQCNLRCTYCYAGEGDYGKNEKMGMKVAKQSLDLFVDNSKNFTIVFFGGEPLLNFALIKEVIQYTETAFPKTTFHFRMTSNGLLLTDKIMSYLNQKKVNLTISYDGKTAQKKQRLNLQKKENERDFAKERIKKFEKDLLKLNGFKLRSTVTADMIEAFTGDLYQIKKDLPFNLGFNRVATDNPQFKYSLEDAKKLMDFLEIVVTKLLEEKKYTELLTLDNIGGHLRIINFRQHKSMTCGAGVNYLSVSTDGSFYLCHRFTEDQEEKIGSVDTGIDRKAVTKILEHRTAQHEPCKGCWMRSICRGGCFHENKMERKTKHAPDPIFCYMQDRTIKMAIKVLLTIKREQPDLLSGCSKKYNTTGR